jgi:hypothetical protein
MARNYKQAKIYCIKVNTEEEYLPYVGSSCKRLLSQRMNQHRDDYKKWKNGKHNFVSSFTLFEKYGVQNCFIELIESFPCNTSDELRKKEREHIEKQKCVNIVKRVIITEEERVEQHKKWYETNKEQIAEKKKEYAQINKEKIAEKKNIYYEANKEQIAEKGKIYQQTHKEEIAERKKEWREANKEQIAEKSKEYAQINKEQIAERKKEYRDEHKEEIAEKKKEKYDCPCGAIICKDGKARHEKSKKHQEYLSTVNTFCTTAVTESS